MSLMGPGKPYWKRPAGSTGEPVGAGRPEDAGGAKTWEGGTATGAGTEGAKRDEAVVEVAAI